MLKLKERTAIEGKQRQVHAEEATKGSRKEMHSSLSQRLRTEDNGKDFRNMGRSGDAETVRRQPVHGRSLSRMSPRIWD